MILWEKRFDMNLPNKLTVLRIILTFVFMFFLFSGGIVSKAAALFVFLLASSTDALDGFLAKKYNQVTDFGKLMDPIADKILVLAAFLSFVEMELVPAWMVVIIILRELTITGLRILALTKNKIIPSDDGGRHKTVSQILTITAILVFLILKEAGMGDFRSYKNMIFVLMSITTILTLMSGVSYLVKNKEVYINAKTN